MIKIHRNNRFLGDTITNNSDYVGFGKKVMRDLQRDHSFSGISTGKKTKVLPDGSILSVSRCFGEEKIRIDRTLCPVKAPTTTLKYACFCDCAVTAGTVSESPASEVDVPAKWIPDKDTLYSGSLCSNGEYLLSHEAIKGLDYFPHRTVEFLKDDDGNFILDEDNKIATHNADNVYGLALEKDVTFINAEGEEETEHLRMPEVEPCNWNEYAFLSIEPLPEQLGQTIETIND